MPSTDLETGLVHMVYTLELRVLVDAYTHDVQQLIQCWYGAMLYTFEGSGRKPGK